MTGQGRALRKIVSRAEALAPMAEQREAPLGARQIAALQIIDHHPIGGEKPRDPRGALDHLLDPGERKPLLVPVEEERENLLLENLVEESRRLVVREVLGGRADREARLLVRGLVPPAVEDREV